MRNMLLGWRLPYPIQLRFSWILCRKFILDDAFLDSETFLASRISGPEVPWRARGLYFPDKSSSAPETEDKNSERDCRYFTGRASEGNCITCLLGWTYVFACEGGRLIRHVFKMHDIGVSMSLLNFQIFKSF